MHLSDKKKLYLRPLIFLNYFTTDSVGFIISGMELMIASEENKYGKDKTRAKQKKWRKKDF